MIKDKSLMEEWEKIVTSMPSWDYGPDDAVFTNGYGLPIRPSASPKSTPKTRNPTHLLLDHKRLWAAQGVAPPDLVFQTYSDGYSFFRACLRDAGPSSVGAFVPSYADGMCIARVAGVNLIWPEK